MRLSFCVRTSIILPSLSSSSIAVEALLRLSTIPGYVLAHYRFGILTVNVHNYKVAFQIVMG